MKAKGFDLMNEWGAKKIPFVFFLNYEKTAFIIEKLNNLSGDKILFSFGDYKHHFKHAPLKVNPYLRPQPIPFNQYQKKFEQVKQALQNGDSYLLNLTCQTPIACNLSLDDIYYSSKALFKARLKDKWVFFSPERFISIENNVLSTFPMKGTIDAAIPNAEQLILDDEKERCEHNTIVDLLRNDISMIGLNTKVEKYRFISEIQTTERKLLQVSSAITADIKTTWHAEIGTILDKLTPAGSICGAPKPKTCQLIKDIENYDRGYYTGIAGVYNGQTLHSCVNIRFIEQTEQGMVFKSGGGIHNLSSVEDEYREMNKKIYLSF